MIKYINEKIIENYLFIESSAVINNIEDWVEMDNIKSELIFKSGLRNVIVDDRKVTHKEDYFLICEVVKNMIDNLPIELRTLRLAVIVNDESKKIGNFWETYSANRGFPFRVFTDINEGIAFINK